MRYHRLVRTLPCWVGLALAWSLPVSAQELPPGNQEAAQTEEKVSTDPYDRIKTEGLEKSQIMDTLSYMTDVIGGRLTNSPEMKRANEWTRDTMAGWGLENAHLEAWGPFGKGWTLKRFSAQVIEPQCIPLIAVPKAWSSGVEGTLVSEVVHFAPKTEDEVESYKGKLSGKIVLMGTPREVPARFEPLGKRYNDTELLEMANAPHPDERDRSSINQMRARMTGNSDFAQRMAIRRKMLELLRDEKPALTIDPSFAGDGGTLFVSSASADGGPGVRVRAWDADAPATVPQIVLAIEQYNRLARMIALGQKVVIAVDLDVVFQSDDLMGYNTIAEIPGTDLKDEVVIIGGHLDSWHGGTGATDNAAGCAVAMEAARIIKALDIKPRRTIRVALWSGEEQGLYGSRAYVKEHFGSIDDEPLSAAVATWFGGSPKRALLKTPEYDNFCGYFNYDNGTGKIRGIYTEGNEAIRPIFRRWLAPFKDMGASTITVSRTGGTDHMSFDAIGLPGFQFIQDEIEYDTRTHHSNMDVYERLQADDLKQSAVIMATFALRAAMADEKLPRKPEPAQD